MAAPSQATFSDVFRVAEFRALWTAEVLSLLGTQFAQVAIAVLVYQRTQSAFLTALAYALSFVPPVAGGPWLSVLADLFPRRGVMIACDLLRATVTAVMAMPFLPLWALCILVAVTALAGVPFTAARTALLPEVLPGDKFHAGAAVGSATGQVSQFAGFVAGAALVSAAGVSGALLLDAASFALSAALVAGRVRRRPAAAEGPSPSGKPPPGAAWSRARLGAHLIAADPVARMLVLFSWLAGFCVVPEALAAPYAHAIGQGPWAVGLLMAAMPAGTVAGVLAVTRLAAPDRRLRMLGWLAMLAAAPLVGSAAHPPLPAVLALWFVSGLGSAYQVIAVVVFVRRMPDYGRGAAIGTAASGLLAAQGLGFVAGGAAAGVAGPETAVALAGACGLAAAAILAIFWRPGRVVPAAMPGPGAEA